MQNVIETNAIKRSDMNLVASAQNLFVRFRYPVSLPQDIGHALGISLENSTRFNNVLQFLLSPQCIPTKLTRFMSREKAEKAFELAQRKEIFNRSSLFSFYFTQGWLEFDLQFDEHSLLRRVYIHHRTIPDSTGFELQLRQDPKQNGSPMPEVLISLTS